MSMYYGNTPIKGLRVHHYEMNTNDCTAIPSDLQSGVTCVSKGKKIIGTGKSFEFAMYGEWHTNVPIVVPSTINTIQIGSTDYYIKTTVPVYDTTLLDFSTSQKIAEVVINEVSYPITVSVQNGMLTISCDHTINIQLFYGKDRYI